MANKLLLSDGRNLDYTVTGARSGFPLVWNHGTPSGYLAIPSLATACANKGLKLITFSRSGYGGSSRHKGRSVVDEVLDVEALLRHLGYDECYVGGWSGGGPHALACAARLKGCRAALVVASLAPFNAEDLDWFADQGKDNVDEFHRTIEGEDSLRAFLETQRKDMLCADAAGIVELLSSVLPEVDKKALLSSEELGRYTVATFREGLKYSCDGWIDDDLAFVKPWGFNMEEIKCPVSLYQGSEDKMVPYGHGRWLASNISEKLLAKHLEDGQGHISIFLGRAERMIDELLNMKKG